MVRPAWVGASTYREAWDISSRGETVLEPSYLTLHGIGAFRLSKGPEGAPMVERLGEDGAVLSCQSACDAALAVPCFTPGTMIETEIGAIPAEAIRTGDRVQTRDHGYQTVLWVGQHQFNWTDLRRNQHMAPILIKAGALGPDMPAQDMLVSPNHRFLVASDQAAILYEDQEVLAAAKHLINNRGVLAVNALGVTYVHFLFERHEVIRANGCWSESFQPADFSLCAIGNAQRTEILELFPSLRSPEGIAQFADARPVLGLSDIR